jgi:hypothetical protein
MLCILVHQRPLRLGHGLERQARGFAAQEVQQLVLQMVKEDRVLLVGLCLQQQQRQQQQRQQQQQRHGLLS